MQSAQRLARIIGMLSIRVFPNVVPVWVMPLLLVSVLIGAGGCSRTDRKKNRVQADQEAYDMIAERNVDPRWKAADYSIDIDPRSRYFDPYDPDRSPMPQDDPASNKYMHMVDGMKGWKQWNDNGVRAELENPAWREALGEYVEVAEDGSVQLNIDSALQLAYMHSPSQQSQLETLYLSALDVTTERFRLDTQFFGGLDTGYAHSGSTKNDQLTVGGNPTLQAQRRFATAGELLVGFANSFLVELTESGVNLASSLANFSFIQPLLRGGGRDVALEQLTIVERGLLANLRAYQQYRQGFYTQVAIGELGVAGPQRGGAGTTIVGFSGQGSVSGYVGLLQQLQQIRNTEDSLSLQVRTLSQLEAHLDGGVIDLVQVDQFRQSIENERASLLQTRNSFELSLDWYKTGTVGLPPDLPIELDDSLIRQFQLVDREATADQNSIAELQDRVGELPDDVGVEPIRLILTDGFKFIEPIRRQLDEVQTDLDYMEEVAPVREQTMADADEREEFRLVRKQLHEELTGLRQQLEKAEAAVETLRDGISEETKNATIRRTGVSLGGDLLRLVQDSMPVLFQRDREQLREGLAELKQQFGQTGADLQRLRDGFSQEAKDSTVNGSVVWLSNLFRLVQGSILVQARARLEAVTVDKIELNSENAFEIALANRMDFMNGRAALVDSWRLIQFNADALQSVLNFTASGDIATARNNAASFRNTTGNLRLGLEFDAPFTRLVERNTYRQALIDYQRSRRELIRSHDSLHLGLRGLLRQIEQLRTNLEIQRRAVAIAIRRVDLTRIAFYAPVRPRQPGQGRVVFGPTAATNLLASLSALRSTQDSFMSVWLNYYAARMRLARELGVMKLDNDGNWIDTPIPNSNIDRSSAGDKPSLTHLPLPPAVPAEWIKLTERLPHEPHALSLAGGGTLQGDSGPTKKPVHQHEFTKRVKPTIRLRADLTESRIRQDELTTETEHDD